MQHSKLRTWIAVINADLVRVEAYVAGTVIVSVRDTLSGKDTKIVIKREDLAWPCTEEIERSLLKVRKKHLELLRLRTEKRGKGSSL